MTAQASWLAPAKINLALHVTGRRDDGYHLIETLAVFTRFGDRLTVEPAEVDGFEVSGPYAEGLPTDDGNLVIRARDRLRTLLENQLSTLPPSVLPDISPTGGEITRSDVSDWPISPPVGEMSGRTEGGATKRDLRHRPSPVLIRLEKNLPIASGVGGGSSDAAATLKALASLWQTDTTSPAFADIALGLGADVPMCLAGEALVARGIGDEITLLPAFPPLGLVLVNPGVPVATKDVFEKLARKDNAPLPPLPGDLTFHSLWTWLESTRNDLELPARAIDPAIGKALKTLKACGAAFVRMSGSGATCFGLYESGNMAKRAAADIRKRQPNWFVAATRTIAPEEVAV